MAGSGPDDPEEPDTGTPWTIFVMLLGTSLIVVFVVAWFLPAWLTAHDGAGLRLGNDVEILKERNAVRTTLLQGIAGVFLLAGAVVAWRQMTDGARQARRAQRATRVAQEATAEQIKLAKSSTRSDQMSRAVTALGDESVAVRVGGVFALEQAMQELDAAAQRPSADPLALRGVQEDGIYTLASLVRTHRAEDPESRKPRKDLELHSGNNPEKEHDEEVDLRVRAPDIQAAMLVIGSRPKLKDTDYDEIAQLDQIDEDDPKFKLKLKLKAWQKRVQVSLHNAYLNNAALSDLNLTMVRFDEAVLAYASLRRADLRCSRLVRADLRRAYLSDADLRWTNLEDADLTRARMVNTTFSGARLKGATFINANLRGAKFEHAVDTDQVRSWSGAIADKDTTWPDKRVPVGVTIKDDP
jgi:hypothetical protein